MKTVGRPSLPQRLALLLLLAAAATSAQVGKASSSNPNIDGDEGSRPFVIGFGTGLNGGLLCGLGGADRGIVHVIDMLGRRSDRDRAHPAAAAATAAAARPPSSATFCHCRGATSCTTPHDTYEGGQRHCVSLLPAAIGRSSWRRGRRWRWRRQRGHGGAPHGACFACTAF